MSCPPSPDPPAPRSKGPPDNFISELPARARASRRENWNCCVHFRSLFLCLCFFSLFFWLFFFFALNGNSWLLEESRRVASAAQSSCKVSLGRKWKQLPQYRLLRHRFLLCFSSAFRQYVSGASPGSGRLKWSSSQLCSSEIAQTKKFSSFYSLILSFFNHRHYYFYLFFF